MERGAFHAWMKLHDAAIADVLDEAVDDLITELAVGHLAAAETQRGLDLVAFVEKPHSLIFLGLVVMLVDGDGELDFLDDDDLLLLARGSLALIFLVEELAVVLYAAHGGNRVGGNFYEIQAALPSDFERFERWEYAELLPIFVNNANFTRADPVIDADKLFCRTLVDVPPPNTRE